MTGVQRPWRYQQALPSLGKSVQASLLVSYTGPSLQAVLLHLGVGRLPLEAHLRQDLRIYPSCGVTIMYLFCCFGFRNSLAFVAIWFPYSDHIFPSLWLCLHYMTVDMFVRLPLVSCSKSTCLPPEALTVKSWIARIFLLIQLYITLFLNSRNFRHLLLFSGRAILLLCLAWKRLW